MMIKTTITNNKTKQPNNLKNRSSSNDRAFLNNDFKDSSINQENNYFNKLKLNENFEKIKNLNNFNYNLFNFNFNKESKHNLCFSSASSLFNLVDSSNHQINRNSNNEFKIIEKENILNSCKKISNSSNDLDNVNKNYLVDTNLFSSNYSCSNKNNANESIKYGELIVLGYNGCINPASMNLSSSIKMNDLNNINRRKSKYILKRKEKPNGVKPATQHNCQSFQEINVSILKKNYF